MNETSIVMSGVFSFFIKEYSRGRSKMVDPTNCIYYLIYRSSLIATSALKKEFANAGVGSIKPAYLGVLLSLWNEDNLQVADLGRRAGLEPSSMTGLLDRMERDEIILRQADPNDRRALRIGLTQAGRQAEETVMNIVNKTFAKLTQGIPEADLSKMREVLHQFLKNTPEEKSEF
ncbi:MarR family transcriptional regulator [Deltaproteobacteria bacterium TL4]